LFGFCLALVAYNVLAVVLAALCEVHGQQKIDHEVSLYYVANDIATTYKGMMIAIPEPEWRIFSTMSTRELAATLVDLAQHVRLEALRKSPTRARTARSKPPRTPKEGHVSTARLLHNRKAHSTTP
jgi:hypothetical protein